MSVANPVISSVPIRAFRTPPPVALRSAGWVLDEEVEAQQAS